MSSPTQSWSSTCHHVSVPAYVHGSHASTGATQRTDSFGGYVTVRCGLGRSSLGVGVVAFACLHFSGSPSKVVRVGCLLWFHMIGRSGFAFLFVVTAWNKRGAGQTSKETATKLPTATTPTGTTTTRQQARGVSRHVVVLRSLASVEVCRLSPTRRFEKDGVRGHGVAERLGSFVLRTGGNGSNNNGRGSNTYENSDSNINSNNNNNNDTPAARSTNSLRGTSR